MAANTISLICAFDVWQDGTAVPVQEEWPTAKKPEGASYRWLHFDLGETELLTWLRENLPDAAAEAMVQQETRPRCDSIGKGMILNLRGVNLNPGSEPEDMVSLRLWICDGLILSARRRKVFAVDQIRQDIVDGKPPSTAEAFLATLAHGLSKRIEQTSLHFVEETDLLEEMSSELAAGLNDTLSTLRQSVIKVRRFVRPQSEALTDLAMGEIWALDPDSKVQLSEAVNRAKRTVEELDSTVERLLAIRDHLDVLHSLALGRNSYVLSVVAAIFLPLGFLTGLLGINVGGIPLQDSNYGFLVVAIGTVLIGVVLYLVFRFAKWLYEPDRVYRRGFSSYSAARVTVFRLS